jgi:hypothetical protein
MRTFFRSECMDAPYAEEDSADLRCPPLHKEHPCIPI